MKRLSETSKVPSASAEESGFAAAMTRGFAAKRDWVANYEVVELGELAERWGCELEGLAYNLAQGDLFSVDVEGSRYVPSEFLRLEVQVVVAVCRALGAMTDTEKLVFWKRGHGALGGQSVLSCLKAEGEPGLERILRLALEHTRERTGNDGSAMGPASNGSGSTK